MKKLALILSISVCSVLTYAQNGNNICVFNSLTYYQDGGGPDELERGKKCSDEAAVNPETQGVSKTWWYRMQIYAFIVSEKGMQAKYPNAGKEAANCVTKLAEINDPKFKEWGEVGAKSRALAVSLYNNGLDSFKAGGYKFAYENWMTVWNLNAALVKKGEKIENPSPFATLANAAQAAEASGNNDGAISIYQTLIKEKSEPKYYRILAAFYKKVGKKEEANKVIEEGLAKYPGDVDILKEKIDTYISEGREGEAVEMLKSAIVLDPKNEKLYYALGVANSKVGKEKEAMDAYNQAIALKPDYSDAYFNMGVMIFNRAVPIVAELNKLGNSEADRKKTEELQAKKVQAYTESKPYFQKAVDIDPNEPEYKKGLTKVKLMLGE